MPHSPVRALALAAAAVLAACGPGPGEPHPRGLSYDVPDPNPATYVFGDTAVFTIAAGLGPMEVVTARAGTAELDFRSWAADRQVLVRFPRLRGSFRNSTQGGTLVDESDVGGPFTVRLDPVGRVTVVDTPSLSTALLDIAGPENLVRPLFVHLPGRDVEAGGAWVDTVTTVEVVAGTRSEARSIVTSRLEDRVEVDGRLLLRIRTRAVSEITVTGTSGGVDVEQRLAGAITGTVLWDPTANVLVERAETGELTGTLELPGTGADPMAVRAALRRSVSLRP